MIKSYLRTPYQQKRAARELAIFMEHRKMISNPYQSKKAAILYIMEKYDIKTEFSVYRILKRVEARLKE